MNLRGILTACYRAFLSPSKARASYSQCGEDMVLRYLFAGHAGAGFFVDVGCHHPRRGSNTYHLHSSKRWRGVLIDLDPEKILACRLVRWRDRGVVAAVSDRREPVDIYAPDHFSVLATIDPGSRQAGFRRLRTVESCTLTDILEAQGAPARFELLCVDAEGMDLAVLRGLDFSRFRPEVICIEVWASRDGIDAVLASDITTFLRDEGYAVAGWAGLSVIYRSAATTA